MQTVTNVLITVYNLCKNHNFLQENISFISCTVGGNNRGEILYK